MKKWYESLFENAALHYDQERFVQGTQGECDFIEQELSYNRDLKIIDIGCGTGRHTIELSKRGYTVAGVDLSPSQIAHARDKAKKEQLDIRLEVADARDLPYQDEYDVAIMMCEGGFPLMETDEENYEILKSVTKTLRKEGKLIFTTLNGLFPLFNSASEFRKDKADGNAEIINDTFDLMTFREQFDIDYEDDLGNKKNISGNQRYYIPSEITWLLKSLGYQNIDIYGAKLGAFSRKDKLTVQDFEMLVIAEL